MNIQPTQEAIESGLMTVIHGEAHFTSPGLFAICWMMTTDVSIDDQSREHNTLAVLRVLRAARAAGFDRDDLNAIVKLFDDGVSPIGTSNESKRLCSLCKMVASVIGHKRLADLISGDEV